MRVAAILDIPFVTLDLEKEYKKKVIDYFLKEYKNNRVPNPDVMCNKYIKFDAFYNFAKKHNAKIATGHYVQIKNDLLIKAKDISKDQVYFLYQIDKNILKDIFFPLGELTKSEVKRLAEKNNLNFLNQKKESMGICMLGGNISPKEFLIKELKPKKGNVVNGKGEIIGEHDGVILYTLGERHGFKIFGDKNQKDFSPHYVIKKDFKKNILTVKSKEVLSLDDESDKNLVLEQINIFIEEKEIKKAIKEKKIFDFQYRYHGEIIKGKIKNLDKNILSIELESEINIQSGQSIVFYDKSTLIGGGILK
jgi:tRNA-specific 2-thiouridylase